jgi:microcin C transport system substrate-binding protein
MFFASTLNLPTLLNRPWGAAFCLLMSCVFASSLALAETPTAKPTHALAMHGAPKYPADFQHFEYANPNAPKGGRMKQAVVGDNFDTFNPFIIRGVAAAGVSNYLYDTLTRHANDEAFSEYGLIAETIEMPEDRSWVTFHINKNARFHDGKAITADDVIFTFKLLTEHEQAQPFYRAYYGDVKEVKKLDDHRVHFVFKTDQNKELPLILGQMQVLPKHWWEKRDFGAASLEIPVGSGPYKIKNVQAGRTVTWERVKDYWAKDLPVNRGFFNFDEIDFEYYKDNTVALEAFKAGQYDVRREQTARNWATQYTGERFDKGLIIKEEIPHEMPVGMQAFIYNTRRPQFQSPLVREALAYAFDFEWTNANLFYGQYKRTQSYFENSELASRGLPTSQELEILKPFKDKVPPEVFTKTYAAPVNEGPNALRENLRIAMEKLQQAGWEIQGGKLVHAKTKQPFTFEILLVQKDFERVVLPFVKNLQRLGITANVRLIDVSQYVNRLRGFDFDMFIWTLGQSDSPGNEQRDYWHSANADVPGARNFIGVKDPVVDQLIDLIIAAPDRDALIHRTRALDRVLLWGHYSIPQWHNQTTRIAYWNKYGHPAVAPKQGVDLDTWWIKQ